VRAFLRISIASSLMAESNKLATRCATEAVRGFARRHDKFLLVTIPDWKRKCASGGCQCQCSSGLPLYSCGKIKHARNLLA
jgi:hypothetical protein